jgi:ribosomal protein S30
MTPAKKPKRPGWEREVQEALAQCQTVRELSRALFSPEHGAFAKAGKTRAQREQLAEHPLYRQAQSRLSELRQVEAVAFRAKTAAPDSRPARMTVQIPRSLHAALKTEAAREGVSVSELVRLKLGFPYSALSQTLIAQPMSHA